MHGARGEDPTEPPASAPYPFPAVSHEPRIQQLSDDLEAAGYHPFHAPCGIRLNEANLPYSACVRCTNCDGFPCVVHAKSDAEVLGVRPALEHDERHAADERARRSSSRRTPAGTAVDRGRRRARRRDRARTPPTSSSLACGAANTAKLLLVSASDQHPNGLANGSDQVGRNYMFHDSQAVLALSTDENPTVFQKTLGLNDFYFARRRARLPAREHPDGRQVAGADVPRREAGPDEARAAAGRWRRSRGTRSTSGSRPRTCRCPDNRVTVDGDGQADPRATRRRTTSPKKELYEQLHSMLGKLRMEPDHLFHRFAYMKNEIPVAGRGAPGRDIAVLDPACSTTVA